MVEEEERLESFAKYSWTRDASKGKLNATLQWTTDKKNLHLSHRGVHSNVGSTAMTQFT